MKDIKIIVASHKQFKMPKDNILYYPIHVGKEGKQDIGFLGDNTGDNISQMNPYFCELTGLYWAWKNLDYDYLGLVHYRRYFSKNGVKFEEGIDVDSVIIQRKDIETLLDTYDILLPKKRKYYIETLYSHYKHTFSNEHLDKTRQIILNSCPEYVNSFDKTMKQTSGYMFNMFIMNRKLVDSYLNWLFPILNALYEEVDITNYTAFEARLFGRVSELLFNVWINHHSFKIKELPFIYLEKINFIKKAKAFLEAKFFGKKYTKSF